jgi:drug/metabolite transporter (DMT)-like permease
LALSPRTRGLLLAGLGVAVISPESLLVRLVGPDPWTIVWYRAGLAGLTLLIAWSLVQRVRPVALVRVVGWLGLTTSVLFAAQMTFFVVSITNTLVANTLVLLATAPLVAAAVSGVVARERVPPRTWFASVAALFGITVILSGSVGTGGLVGNLAGLGAAVAFGLNLAIIRRRRAVDLIPAMGVGGLAAAALATPFATPTTASASDLIYLGVSGMVLLPASFALITTAPRLAPAAEVGLVTLLEVVLGPLWVWWAIGESVPATAWIGGVIVISALGIDAWLGRDLGRLDKEQAR